MQHYQVLSGTFTLLDDLDATFTAQDMLVALTTMIEPRIDEDGAPHPRLICWRDPKRRVVFGNIHDLSEDDSHEPDEIGMALTLTEVLAEMGVDY